MKDCIVYFSSVQEALKAYQDTGGNIRCKLIANEGNHIVVKTESGIFLNISTSNPAYIGYSTTEGTHMSGDYVVSYSKQLLLD